MIEDSSYYRFTLVIGILGGLLFLMMAYDPRKFCLTILGYGTRWRRESIERIMTGRVVAFYRVLGLYIALEIPYWLITRYRWVTTEIHQAEPLQIALRIPAAFVALFFAFNAKRIIIALGFGNNQDRRVLTKMPEFALMFFRVLGVWSAYHFVLPLLLLAILEGI